MGTLSRNWRSVGSSVGKGALPQFSCCNWSMVGVSAERKYTGFWLVSRISYSVESGATNRSFLELPLLLCKVMRGSLGLAVSSASLGKEVQS